MHPQDKSGDDVRAFWHRDAPPRESYEEAQAWSLEELLDEYPALLTFDEARIARVRDREDWGESQERLARLASLHGTEIGLLEKGERVCRIDTLVRLAGAMAVPPGELLDGIDWVPGPETDGAFGFSSRPTSPRPRPRKEEVSE